MTKASFKEGERIRAYHTDGVSVLVGTVTLMTGSATTIKPDSGQSAIALWNIDWTFTKITPVEPTGNVLVEDANGNLYKRSALGSHPWYSVKTPRLIFSWKFMWENYGPLKVYDARD